jgi:cobalt-zinc-cadmium efflux system outer membrane protein
MFPRRLAWLGLAIALGGCCFPVREQVDRVVCDLATHPIDPAPLASTGSAYASFAEEVKPAAFEIELVNPAEEPGPPPRTLKERLKIPAELPGAQAPPLQLPPLDPANPKLREEAFQRIFPPLPAPGEQPPPAPGPYGRPLNLSDLQQLGLTNNPKFRQAAADVEAAKGAAIQAGLYPNPIAGYEADTINQGGTAGLQGAYIEQIIKTAGKLKLAQAAAAVDVANSELRLKEVQADLAARVRAGYFAVLVAQENVKVTRALALFTEEAYRIQVEQVRGGQAAPYEPLQLRVLAVQARADLVRARNRHTAAWKELAATIGLPAMPLTELSGRVDMPVPLYYYDAALNWILTHHTEVHTALNEVLKARYNLRLAQVAPVPDVGVRVMVQKDFTTPPFLTDTSVQVGVPVPIWDKNQGNIRKAQAELLRANEESHRVRNELTARLAEAFQRYDNGRILVSYYRDQILPDQVQTYRGAYLRHQQEPDAVGFADVVIAQQTLANAIVAYIAALGDMWAAVADVSNLLQTNDLFQMGTEPVPSECLTAPTELLPLPCCHGCSPLQDPWLKGVNGEWPGAQ